MKYLFIGALMLGLSSPVVAQDNKAAIEYAQKILEIKPDDEGIKQVVETLSKSLK